MSKQAVDILITLLTNGTITEDDVITALNDYKGENKVPFDKLPKITLRSDGRFMMNIPAKHSPTGKRYPVYGSSEEEVKRNYKHTIVIPLAKEPTIEEYMFTVMRAYFYGNMEDTTYDRYENAYYGIVFGSDFGKIKLKETSGLILTNYIKELKKTSISSKSISMIKTLIRKTFLHAKENGLVDDNVAEYMVSSNKRHNQSPTKKKYKESFNFLEISKIESVIKNEWNKKRKWRNTTTRKFLYGPMFMIMYHTGLRIGDDDDKIRLNQRKPSKYKGLSRFGPEKNLQRINKFMKERPTFYKKLIQMKENFRFYLRCFYCITKVVILQFNSEKQDRISS